MEKNWTKEIIEFIHNAMNEGLTIYNYEPNKYEYQIRVIRDYKAFDITICKSFIDICSPSGYKKIENKLSERDELEIKAMMLSIKEYREDVAISEFEHFFKKDDKPTTIDNLDDDD